MQYLRSLAFTSLLFATTLIYAFVVLALSWLPPQKLYSVARSWSHLQLWLLKVLCGLRYRIRGGENIPADNHISMWKHSSAWETIAQMIIFPPQAWVLKRELMWIPIVGWAIRCLHPIAINRQAAGTAVNQVLNQGRDRLERGLWILIFPEGTRMPMGQTRRYGVSGALLASRCNRKIIPVAHNAGDFWPRRGWLKKPGTIDVVIGPPIDAAGHEPRELNLIAQEWIESTVASLR